MRLITGTRQSGKTTNILQEANDSGLIVLAANEQTATQMRKLAFRMALTVDVMAPHEFPSLRERGRPSVAIDEAQWVFESMLNVNVQAMSVTAPRGHLALEWRAA